VHGSAITRYTSKVVQSVRIQVQQPMLNIGGHRRLVSQFYYETLMDLNNPDFLTYTSGHGIIFVYESWTNEHSIIDVQGFRCYNLYRMFQNKRSKTGHGGVVIYVKDSISKGVRNIQNHHDTIVWLKLDKGFFRFDTDVCIAGVYMWVEDSPAYMVTKAYLFSDG